MVRTGTRGLVRARGGVCPLLQVYAVALYVEAERAAKELGVRKRGGFFDDNRCAKFSSPTSEKLDQLVCRS